MITYRLTPYAYSIKNYATKNTSQLQTQFGARLDKKSDTYKEMKAMGLSDREIKRLLDEAEERQSKETTQETEERLIQENYSTLRKTLGMKGREIRNKIWLRRSAQNDGNGDN